MAAMPTPRETWTDERLDDLNQKVDDGFRDTRVEIRDVRAEIRQFRGEVNARFEGVDAHFDAMQRLILQVSAGLFGTMLIGFLGVIVAVLNAHS